LKERSRKYITSVYTTLIIPSIRPFVRFAFQTEVVFSIDLFFNIKFD